MIGEASQRRGPVMIISGNDAPPSESDWLGGLPESRLTGDLRESPGSSSAARLATAIAMP
jgi:hypothetical protein